VTTFRSDTGNITHSSILNNTIQKTNTGAVAEDQEETDRMIPVAEGKYRTSACLEEQEEALAFLAYPLA